MPALFNLQGHRGARGLKPENTLPSFEIALDVGVSSIETDLHLTRDGQVIIAHDPVVSPRLFRLTPGSRSPDPASQPLIASLTLEELRGYRADQNPDRQRFPRQDVAEMPLARRFAEARGFDPYAAPTLADLFDFVQAYAGLPGLGAGKTPAQQARASLLQFDLELKRTPFRPDLIGDAFDGSSPGLLEQRCVECIRSAGVLSRTIIRSFDHRAVHAMRQVEPGITGAILVAGTALIDPAGLVRQADAQIYCPDYQFLDERQLRQCHAEGIRVLPWTVNDPAAWTRLLDWQVDGITTDFPDRLALWLQERGVQY